MGKWIKSWNVPSSTGTSSYVVSVDRDGNYGCSCPVWKFRREECKHIKQVKGGEFNGHTEVQNKPRYELAMVNKPSYDSRTHTLYIPLIRLPDTAMMEVTICYYLLKYGYSMSEIRQLRKIPADWSANVIKDFITRNGEAEYKDSR
jgi:hypothetical protein